MTLVRQGSAALHIVANGPSQTSLQPNRHHFALKPQDNTQLHKIISPDTLRASP
jgi:hypothetical protein